MKEKTINVIKCIFLFILFITISAILQSILKIDINKFNDLEMVIYSLSCSLLFLSISHISDRAQQAIVRYFAIE